MNDEIMKINKSVIQHGKLSDRVYIMKLVPDDIEKIISVADELVRQFGYTKIFAKVQERFSKIFFNNGFVKEAEIQKFYDGKENVLFLSKFFNEQRKQLSNEKQETVNNILKTSFDKSKNSIIRNDDTGNNCIKFLDDTDAEFLCELYKKVFETYPFPIFEPEYIKQTMKTHIDYFGVYEDEKIVAAASAEKDSENKNVEMTDFATLPEYRGKGFASELLVWMEQEMLKQGIKTFYTISRAYSYGINITFSKAGYKYGGTLINNTNISGEIESMNVWYKNN